MARFTIYTYMFKPINEPEQPELFVRDVDVEESLAKKQELFGNCFLSQSNIKFSKGENIYKHTVAAQREGIIAMRLANNSKQVHERDFVRTTEEDNPSLYVLIDNRKDRQIVAIENRQQAFTETQTVAKIMEETFNKMLFQHRLQVAIRAKFHTHEFWDVVSEYENGIASVTFKFPYPNLPEISDMVGEYYTQLALNTNSEPKTTIKATPKERLLLEKGDLLLERMISAASASGEQIMMRPKGTRKWRRIGIDTLAQEELPDSILKGLEEPELIPRKWHAIEQFMDRIQTVYV